MNEIKFPKIFKPLRESHRYKVMFGGRGCVHADTLIDTPNGQIKVKDFNGGEVYSYSKDGHITAHACKPIKYPKTKLYKISFDNGYSITCTANHKFLTETAWLTCHEVFSERVPVYASYPHQTSSDTSLSEYHANVPRCLNTLLNYLYGYLEDYRLSGEQPQKVTDTFLDVLQQLSDELRHNSHALNREGGQESLSTNTRSSSSRLLSSLGALLSLVAQDCEALGSYDEPKTFELFSDLCLASRQSHENIILDELVLKLSDFFLHIYSSSSNHQAQSLLTIQHMLQRGVDDGSYSDSLINPKNGYYTTATTIKEVGEDHYYDLFVPIYNNYLTDGVVNHNSAKSWTVARQLLLMGLERPIRVLCTRELQKSIKQSVHKLLKDQINTMGLNGFYDTIETSIKGKNGTEFIFMGVKHNPEEIKSTEGIDICWIEEAANITEASWDIIDPTVRKPGSEIWITFNTRFKFDHIYQLFIANDPPPGSWVQRVNYSDNPFFPDVLEKQMDHMKQEDFEKYLFIWEGQLKMLADGAIFGKQMIQMRKESRICIIPIEPSVEVHTFWDLGRNDHTAIWFMQNVGKEYRMIDYYENRLQDIDHYCRIIKSKNYLYGTHFMPHDIEHQMLGMNKTRKKQFEDGGVFPIKTVPRIKEKNEAIEMARQSLPSVWIDEKRCERGIECLSNYRYEYNDDRDTHNQSPHHDWASNGSDAFMQFAQGYKDQRKSNKRRQPKRVAVA